MPISKSAKKALRVATKKTEVNRRRKVALKNSLKGVTSTTIAKAFSMIDKAAKWGIIEPNKASRMKSGLAKEIGSTPAVTDKPAAKAAAPEKATVKPKATPAKKPVTKKTTK